MAIDLPAATPEYTPPAVSCLLKAAQPSRTQTVHSRLFFPEAQRGF